AGPAWRDALPAVHAAGRRLARAGAVVLRQRGARVEAPRGACRIAGPPGG
ncbi:DUF3253 domain-containing protein, partial [Thermaurantiacus sp.]